MDKRLGIIFFILSLLHLQNVLLCVTILFLRKTNLSLKLHAFIGFLTTLPLLISDIIYGVIFINTVPTERKFLIMALYFDTYTIFMFHGVYTGVIIWKLSQITKGIAPRFYDKCIMILVAKSIILPAVLLICLTICSQFEKYYAGVFLSIFNVIVGANGISFAYTMRAKLKSMNLIYGNGSQIQQSRSGISAKGSAKILSSTSLNGIETDTVSKSKSKMDIFATEFKAFVNGLIIGIPLNVVCIIPLLILFSDGSQRSDIIVRLSWKFTLAITIFSTQMSNIRISYKTAAAEN